MSFRLIKINENLRQDDSAIGFVSVSNGPLSAFWAQRSAQPRCVCN